MVSADLLRSRLAADPAGTAAMDLSGRRLAVSELDSDSAALAGRLGGPGPPGLVVAALPNRIEAMTAAFAVLRTGHALAMVHPELPEAVRKEALSRLRPVAEIVQDGESLAVVADPYGPAADLWRPPRDRPDLGIAVCVLTSGSTGRPRLIAAPHRQVRTAIGLIGRRLGYRPGDVVAAVPPLSFDYGLYQLLLAMAGGATVLLDPRLGTVQGLTHAIAQAGVTVLPLVPTVLRALVAAPMTGRVDTGRVRLITTTGDLLTEPDAEAARSRFPHAQVLPMYGLSECKRVAITPAAAHRPPGAVGLPLDGTDVAISDGQLVVSGPHLTLGYLADEAATARRFTVDSRAGVRLLRTGDCLRQDGAGWLHWVGRGSDMIKTSGYRIAPAELETAAAASGVVLESGAYGRPDPVRGQVPVLVCRLRPGLDGDAAAPRLDDTLRRLLPRWATPQVEISGGPLPRTANGKIDRGALSGGRPSAVDDDDRTAGRPRALPFRVPGPVSRQLINCHTQAFLSAFTLPYDLSPVEFELLTTVPFGVRANVDDPHRLLVPHLDPDAGLDRACELLGLRLQTVWHGPDEAQAALALLDRWLRTGPVLLGPLDLGRLPYHEVAETLRGCDHYLVALGREADGEIVVRDPEGFVRVELDDTALLSAWAAEAVPEGRGAFTMRRLARGDGDASVPVDLLSNVATLAAGNLATAASEPAGGAAAYHALARMPTDATRRRGLSLLLPSASTRYAMGACLVRHIPGGDELAALFDQQVLALARAHGDVVGGADPRARFEEAAEREDAIAARAVAMRRLVRA